LVETSREGKRDFFKKLTARAKFFLIPICCGMVSGSERNAEKGAGFISGK